MPAFRSVAARRAEDQKLLTHLDTPALADGEWVRYWTRLPHGAEGRVDSAGTRFTSAGTFFDPVARVRVLLIEGIVDWAIRDENGRAVPWDRAKADELIDGMDEALLALLAAKINSERPPTLGTLVNATGEPVQVEDGAEPPEGAVTEGND